MRSYTPLNMEVCEDSFRFTALAQTPHQGLVWGFGVGN
jgi:hypothetical protein